jgi:hypothetical protein
VPGLDSIDPHKVAVAERVKAQTGEGKLLVLSPVSLVLTKLHALRALDQNNRHDLLHLLVCLKAARLFIEETSKQDARCAMWNCQRLIDAQWQKPNRTLEREYGFRILESVPITRVRIEAAKKARNTGEPACGPNGQQEAGLAIYDGQRAVEKRAWEPVYAGRIRRNAAQLGCHDRKSVFASRRLIVGMHQRFVRGSSRPVK